MNEKEEECGTVYKIINFIFKNFGYDIDSEMFFFTFGVLKNGKPDLPAVVCMINALGVAIDSATTYLDVVPWVGCGRLYGHNLVKIYLILFAVIFFVWTSPFLVLAMIRLLSGDVERDKYRSAVSLIALYFSLLSTYYLMVLDMGVKTREMQWIYTVISRYISAGCLLYWLGPDFRRYKNSYAVIFFIFLMYTTEAYLLMTYVIRDPECQVNNSTNINCDWI